MRESEQMERQKQNKLPSDALSSSLEAPLFFLADFLL